MARVARYTGAGGAAPAPSEARVLALLPPPRRAPALLAALAAAIHHNGDSHLHLLWITRTRLTNDVSYVPITVFITHHSPGRRDGEQRYKSNITLPLSGDGRTLPFPEEV